MLKALLSYFAVLTKTFGSKFKNWCGSRLHQSEMHWYKKSRIFFLRDFLHEFTSRDLLINYVMACATVGPCSSHRIAFLISNLALLEQLHVVPLGPVAVTIEQISL